MARKISDRVTWVGKIDWELRTFHGHEYSTRRGSSYNSYLVKGSEKTVLIDTVWKPFDLEFVARLKEVIDLHKIDAIVMNHNEIDHSGALMELLSEIPGTPIYCTRQGMNILRGHFHQDWNYQVVKTGDTLDLGDCTLTFIEAPMLHWPDTMFTYMSGEEILFSNDGFGQHYASESLTNTDVDQDELYYEAMKYYANILTPFSPMVTRKIKEIVAMNLPIKMICPSHGVMWVKDPLDIVYTYLKWADAYQENRVLIMYDTMWNSTRTMAEEIANGIYSVRPDLMLKVVNVATEDKNDVLTEIFRSKAVLAGSPTINNGITYAMAGILEMTEGLKFKNKKAAAFGSYGWSGEAVKQISAWLQKSGFALLNDGLRCLWVPDQAAIDACRKFGADLAKDI